MSRTLSLLAVAASGCIIYEDRWDDRHGCPSCVEPTEPGPTVGDDDDDTTAPEPPGPIVTADLALTESSAYPGDSLLSSLVVVSGQVDLEAIESVVFERDVSVLDTMPRDGELVLLLEVADDAAPGEVDVFVEGAGGQGWILAEPFVVLDPATSGGDTGGTGGTGGGECPPAGGGVDTGCP